MDKSDLRKHVRAMKQLFTKEQLQEKSATIIQKLRTYPLVVKAQTILLYYSLDDEVDTHQFIDELASQGKTVLLPTVINDTDLELHRYTGPDDLDSGFFGIKEPTGELFTDYDAIDVAIVPGVAFDRQGNRLGRGKGYYDRLLPRLTRAYKIGICFDFQRLPGIPSEPHDIQMDEVFT